VTKEDGLNTEITLFQNDKRWALPAGGSCYQGQPVAYSYRGRWGCRHALDPATNTVY